MLSLLGTHVGTAENTPAGIAIAQTVLDADVVVPGTLELVSVHVDAPVMLTLKRSTLSNPVDVVVTLPAITGETCPVSGITIHRRFLLPVDDPAPSIKTILASGVPCTTWVYINRTPLIPELVQLNTEQLPIG